MAIVRQVVIAISILLVGYLAFCYSGPVCRFPVSHELCFGRVAYGEFTESTPQTGIFRLDSVDGEIAKVTVEIDEFYLSRISKGLKSTTELDGREFFLSIAEINSEVVHGRFKVVMNFDGDVPLVENGRNLRMRLRLSDPCTSLLVPTGSFYWQNKGKWIFVVIGDSLAVKRKIDVGRKGPDYIEIEDGLKQGEKVILSDLDDPLPDRDTVMMAEILKLYD